MEFWTILFITALSGPIEGQEMAVAYPSLAACEAATSAVGETLGYDAKFACVETETASRSIRPMPRPEGLK